MKNKNREVLELRQKTLGLYDILSQISQFSWRIKKTKEIYSIEQPLDVYYLMIELVRILKDYIEYTERELPNIKESYSEYSRMIEEWGKEGGDEN